MAQDILITPGSGEPQILFRGSGTTDTAVELNVLSSYQSATGSGTALTFEGTQGQLFGITDNLSSGTIFSVSDITGLPLIEADASGDVKLGEFGRYVGVGSGVPLYPFDVSSSGHFQKGFTLASHVPAVTTNTLYNDGGTLKFNGTNVVDPYTSGVAAYSSGNTIVNDGLIAYASGNTANINFGSNAEGDILYHNGTAFVRLARGTDNYILKMNGNVPNWEAESGGGGGMTNFTLAGDGGSNQTIADGNTLTVAGGNGITTTGAATDTVSIAVDAAQTTITSLLATDIKIGEDDDTKIDFETANEIHFDTGGSERVKIDYNGLYVDKIRRLSDSSSTTKILLNDEVIKLYAGHSSNNICTIDSTGLTIDNGSLETATIDYTDGDNAMTIADGGGVTFPQAATFTSGLQSNGAVTVGVDDTGHDVKFYGATSGSYLEWDESVDTLNLVGAAYVQEAVPANDTPTAEDATVTLDLRKGNFHNISLGNNVTKFEFTNAKRGQRFILRITQNASSAKSVSWSNVDSDSSNTSATIRWASNRVPTMSTSTSHTDVYGFLCTNNAGTAFDGFIIGQDLPD